MFECRENVGKIFDAFYMQFPFDTAVSILPCRHENEKEQAELGLQDAISKKILVLGAGKVSSPLIEYHTRKPGTSVTIGELATIQKCDLIE